MSQRAAIGLDLGTSSLKAVLVTENGTVQAQAQRAYPVLTPQPGWAETDPALWETAAHEAVAEVLAAAPDGYELIGLGIDGQMHGLVLADECGTPTRPAVLWPDSRAAAALGPWQKLDPGQRAALANPVTPVLKWRDAMFFFLSTKMMPAVAGLLPMYLIIKNLGALDNIWTLVVLYLSANLPLGIWMLRSFFVDFPRELVEAATLDGANLVTTIRHIILPLTYPGIAATALISFIFAWNEFLFALNLTATRAYTSPVYLIGLLSGQRLFLAHLCAASVLVSLPVLIAGYAAQDKLVQGLSLGAVK